VYDDGTGPALLPGGGGTPQVGRLELVRNSKIGSGKKRKKNRTLER
jgi:hypothetical protein